MHSIIVGEKINISSCWQDSRSGELLFLGGNLSLDLYFLASSTKQQQNQLSSWIKSLDHMNLSCDIHGFTISDCTFSQMGERLYFECHKRFPGVLFKMKLSLEKAYELELGANG